jgi:hypothetical protein
MSLGLNDRKRRHSKYGLQLPDISLESAIYVMADSMIEFAQTLRTHERALAGEGKPVSAESAGASAWGAQRAAKALFDFASIINNELTSITTGPPSGIYSGTTNVVDGGPDHPVNYSPAVTATWTTATSVIFGWIPYSPPISDPSTGFFACALRTLTPGASFDFAARQLWVGEPYDVPIHWIGFNP